MSERNSKAENTVIHTPNFVLFCLSFSSVVDSSLKIKQEKSVSLNF